MQDIRDQVSRMGALRLLSAGAVSRYGDGENRRLAAETGADRIIEGSVRVNEGQIRVDVELIDTKTEQTLWRQHFDRKLADVVTVQSEIAERIADALGAKRAAGEQSRIEKRPTDNMEAYDLFLRSRRIGRGREGLEKQARMLEAAIALDPKFAAAMSRLAGLNERRLVYGDASRTEEAISWANKALAIDPLSDEAHVALANNYWYLGRLASSRAAFQRALELNPNSLGAMDDGAAVDVDLGRFEEALQLTRRALLLSPNVSFVYYHVAVPLLLLDDPALGERWLAVYRSRFPSDSRLIDMEIQLRLMKKQTGEALAMARKRVKDQPDNAEARAMLAEVAFLASSTDSEALTEPYFRSGPEPRFGNYGLLPQSSRTRYGYLLMKRGASVRAAPLLDQAQKAVEALLADGSDTPLAFEELACIAAIRGDIAGALMRYRQAYKAGWHYLMLTRMNPMLAVPPARSGVSEAPRPNDCRREPYAGGIEGSPGLAQPDDSVSEYPGRPDPSGAVDRRDEAWRTLENCLSHACLQKGRSARSAGRCCRPASIKSARSFGVAAYPNRKPALGVCIRTLAQCPEQDFLA